jgi:hypothetical protein
VLLLLLLLLLQLQVSLFALLLAAVVSNGTRLDSATDAMHQRRQRNR